MCKTQKMEEFMCAEVQPDHHADGVCLLHHGDPGRVRAGTPPELAVLDEALAS